MPCSPNCDPALPRFFITHDHPRNLGHLSWVGSVDPVELAHLSKAGTFKNMGYPTSILDNDLFQAGLIKIPDEVTIFVENVRGTRLCEDDVVKVIAAGAQANRTMFPEDVAKLKQVRDRILGPKEERDAAAGDKGTAFERMPKRAKRNGQHGRCYSTALTTEAAKQLTHPAESVRTLRGEEGHLDEASC